jgi:uncharacterized protein DUF4349
MGGWQDESIGWRRPLAAFVVVVVVCVVAIGLLGTQAGHILSTVGASVGPPDAGTVDGAGGPGAAGGNDGSGAEDPASGAAGAGSGDGGQQVSARMLDATRPDLLVIKTGEVSIQAAAIGPAVAKVTEQIVGLGGYASGSTRSGKGDDATASVTFRVPANQWEAALAAARGAGDDVIDEQTETVDVTGDVVDLRARIRNLQATESAIETIMARAGTIDDVLDVQSRLSDVRGEIEQLTSKAADLEARAAFSTLTVRIGVRPAPVVARQKAEFDPGHEVDAATARLVGILQHAATVGIWAGIVWLPILLALAILGGVGLFVTRRARRALGGPGDAAPVPEGGA